MKRKGGEEMTEEGGWLQLTLSVRRSLTRIYLLSNEPRLLAMLRASGPLSPTTRPSRSSCCSQGLELTMNNNCPSPSGWIAVNNQDDDNDKRIAQDAAGVQPDSQTRLGMRAVMSGALLYVLSVNKSQ